MSQTAYINGTVFELARPLTDLSPDLRLRSAEWGLLFAVSGRHTVGQIENLLGLESDAARRSWHRLLELGLIRERELTYGEYLRASAATTDEGEMSLRRFLQQGAAWQGAPADETAVVDSAPTAPQPAAPEPTAPEPTAPQPAAPQPAAPQQAAVIPPPKLPVPPQDLPKPAPVPTREASREGMADDATFDPTVTRAVPTMSRQEILAFRPLGSPPSARSATAAQRSLSLRALMDYILQRAPDMNSGQLDVYRVFIRVDGKLLRRNGITTLRFEEDRRIDDPELQGAIVSSLQATLGLPCPEQVYVS